VTLTLTDLRKEADKIVELSLTKQGQLGSQAECFTNVTLSLVALEKEEIRADKIVELCVNMLGCVSTF